MQPQTHDSGTRPEIILDLLNSVESDSEQSQRGRASEFGVAVGLVNAYLKFCIKKGYIKVKRFPARRYSYLLTPKGFSEKSRLAILLLSNSLTFFRQARTDCAAVFAEAQQRGWKRVLLIGISEVAEISLLCALERGIVIASIVQPAHADNYFMGVPVIGPQDVAQDSFDGVIITAIADASRQYADAIARFGDGRVLAPSLLAIPETILKRTAAA